MACVFHLAGHLTCAGRLESMTPEPSPDHPVALITGAAQRVGAAIAKAIHGAGFNLVIHFRNSAEAAKQLREDLEGARAESVELVQADLLDLDAMPDLVSRAAARWGRLDALINNASTFYPTPLGQIEERHWIDLIGTNLKAPLFLSQAALPHLQRNRGTIINIADVHGIRPMKSHPLYSAAKAGLIMLTQALARDLGPQIRVNAVAPGAILWPGQSEDPKREADILDRTALKRRGSPDDVAKAVLYLLKDAPYVTGHVLAVDGGRLLNQ